MWIYLGLAILALLFYILKSFKYDYWDKKGIPTASGCEWLFGHYKPIFFVKQHMNDFCGAMYKEFPDAPLVGFYMMNLPALLVRDLEIVKTILSTEFQSFNSNGLSIDRQADILAGSNPFFLSGDEWKSARNNVTPALSLAKLKGYLPNILLVGDQMVKHLKKVTADGPVELEARKKILMLVTVSSRKMGVWWKSNLVSTRSDWMAITALMAIALLTLLRPSIGVSELFTTDVIANAIFGIKNNSFEDTNSLFAEITREIVFNFSITGNIRFICQKIPILRTLFPARFTNKKLEKVLVSVTHKIMEERKASGEKRNDLFQVLGTLKENDTRGVITVEYMSGQVFTVIADLYDTSSNAIAVILYMLSRHPDIQEKLRTEIKEMIRKCNGEITVDDVENVKYLNMVFFEFFRMFSFVSSKECTQDCYLPMPGSAPLMVTKGTPMIIPVVNIHNDPKYYPEPEKFIPERFTEEEIAKRPKYTYMPFGEGPRKCVGMRIANLQMKVAIIKILENFRLKLSSKTKYPVELDPATVITLRPKDGTWVIFEQIN